VWVVCRASWSLEGWGLPVGRVLAWPRSTLGLTKRADPGRLPTQRGW
jgi:hypothetical protein